MFRTAHPLGSIVILAAAVVLATPGFGQAQRHGGGGAHVGGAHVGGAHVGGAHVGGAHVSGYRGGTSNYGRYRSGNSYTPYGDGYRRSYSGYSGGYYPYYGHYGSYPYYGDYGDDYGSLTSGLGTTAAPGYADVTRYYLGGDTPPIPPGESDAASSPRSSGFPAHLTVKVPSDALVWFDDVLMTSTGPVRKYETPPLALGQYSYAVRARWNDNGHEVTQTQPVGVSAGALVEVDFPPEASGR